ncbi:phospholipase effector Tle1 domain-containing protein [Desulfobotulus alkaliphilus]|uniref:phospholipase effector Tle1 domain-containing protein n=1 Tax=Desulfobotulus alkaliphilus TaxID=622671 RepID=UPI001C94F285|nr:DUF2235 domain-containing protein [Desulfobotulus alkaliphilus]
MEYSTNPLNQYTAVTGLASITHDEDGNFKEMGDRVFVWNAENRLIRTEPKAAAAGDSRTEYAYDYMGRRVQKISYLFDGTDWVKGEERLFVYQGWNLVEEIRLAGGKEESRYFVWGLDLSQSLQGAGGVGGLLAMVEEGGSHLYAYDANGNVGQVVKASDGSLAAAYEYDPFGRLTASSGGMADVNPFRFSTKYFDGESGFYYYGYRYYAVELGRWASRDPIEEEGGINLYGFVGNDGLNWVDRLGLALYAFDGTWNHDRDVREGKYTHVYTLSDKYIGNAFYQIGVGGEKFFGNKMMGGMFGAGGKERIEKAYRRFLENYKNGDKDVDIIGFSRGASLAREFANVLHERGYREYYGTIFETRGCPVDIRFVGLFDTVGSFAVPGRNSYVGIRMDLPPNVKNAAHAVARDEKRLLFPLKRLNKAGVGQNFSERDFAGDHSDIGRGHGVNTTNLSIAPLVYIWEKGIDAGVPFGPLPSFSTDYGKDPWGWHAHPHDMSEDWPYNLMPKGGR